MKRALTILTLTAAAIGASAETWSLDRCVEYAVDNNLTVEQRRIDCISARQEVTAAANAALPTVSAGLSQQWSFGRGLTAANTYADRNTSNFGLQAGLNLPLFDGLQTVRNYQLAKTSLSAALEGLDAAKDNITIQVMAQYLQALYCGELEGVARSNAELTEEELERRRALLDAGRIPEADMLDASSQAAQARLQLVNARNDRAMALLDLKQMLRLPADADFEVEALEGDTVPLPEPAWVYNRALGGNHALLASQWQVKAADRRIALAKTGWIPRLSFSAGLGDNYYRLSGMPNESFGDQFRHNFSQYVGFNLSIPIFDAFSTRNSVRRAKVQRLTAGLNVETYRDNLYRAIYETWNQAVASRERLVAAEEAATAGAASLAAVQEKYGLGRATPVDFDNARNQLYRAMSERAQARYELLLRARILDFYANPPQY